MGKTLEITGAFVATATLLTACGSESSPATSPPGLKYTPDNLSSRKELDCMGPNPYTKAASIQIAEGREAWTIVAREEAAPDAGVSIRHLGGTVVEVITSDMPRSEQVDVGISAYSRVIDKGPDAYDLSLQVRPLLSIGKFATAAVEVACLSPSSLGDQGRL